MQAYNGLGVVLADVAVAVYGHADAYALGAVDGGGLVPALELVLPAKCLGCGEYGVAVVHFVAGPPVAVTPHIAVARTYEVVVEELHGVDVRVGQHVVDDGHHGALELLAAEAADSTAGDGVSGIHAGVDVPVLALGQRDLHFAETDGGYAVSGVVGVAGGDVPVTLYGGHYAVLDGEAGSKAAAETHLMDGELILLVHAETHRFAGQAGEQRGVEAHQRHLLLVAVGAANVEDAGLYDGVGGHTADVGRHLGHAVGLCGGPHQVLVVDVVIVHYHLGRLGSQRRRVGLEVAGALVDEVGLLAGLVAVAALDGEQHLLVAEAEILLITVVLKESRVELGGAVGLGFFDVEHGRQNLVVDLDETDGLLAQLLSVGRDKGDAVADIAQVLVANLLDRRQTLEEFLGELRLVLVGDDGADAGQRLGRGGVDVLYHRVRVGAGHQLGVQHVLHLEVVKIHAFAGDYLAGFFPGAVLADVPVLRLLRSAHASTPFLDSFSRASRT